MIQREPHQATAARTFDRHRLRKRGRRCKEMMNWEAWQQHREEMVREVELNRLAKALRTGRKARGSRVFLLRWELRRTAGLVLKFAKTFKNPRKGTRT